MVYVDDEAEEAEVDMDAEAAEEVGLDAAELAAAVKGLNTLAVAQTIVQSCSG